MPNDNEVTKRDKQLARKSWVRFIVCMNYVLGFNWFFIGLSGFHSYCNPSNLRLNASSDPEAAKSSNAFSVTLII